MKWIRTNWGRISHITVGFIITAANPLAAVALAVVVVGREWLQENEYRIKDQKLAVLNKSWIDLCEWIIGIAAGGVAGKVFELWIL